MLTSVIIDVCSVILGLDNILCACDIIFWVTFVNVYVA